MLLIGSENRGDWDCAVEGDESPAVPYRQGEQINVGNLFGAVKRPLSTIVWSKMLKSSNQNSWYEVARRLLQSLYDFRGGHRVRVLRLRHDSNAPIFGEWARCPPCCSLML